MKARYVVEIKLDTEGEYVFDMGSISDSYFYAWSELTTARWSGFGLAW